MPPAEAPITMRWEGVAPGNGRGKLSIAVRAHGDKKPHAAQFSGRFVWASTGPLKRAVHRIIALLPADVARPIAHFANSLRFETLVHHVRPVPDCLVSAEVNSQNTLGE